MVKGNYKLSTTNEIIAEAKAGKMFILVDDENRENEGDLVIPAEMCDDQKVNFMAKYGRALTEIENLKGMKISKQLSLIKKLLDIYKEDPIIAIAILEKGNATLYDDLDDECNQLLLELGVRREIVNDTRNKVGNILR